MHFLKGFENIMGNGAFPQNLQKPTSNESVPPCDEELISHHKETKVPNSINQLLFHRYGVLSRSLLVTS